MARPRRTRPPDPELDPDADPEQVARAICLRLLTGAPRTRAQLAAALTRRGVPDDVATAVLDRLTEVRLVDDGAFAESWVHSRHAGRGLARRALGHELRARGVAQATVEEALSTLGREEEVATARALVRRRLPALAGLPSEVRVRRLAGLLARKGYPPSVALGVVREALADDDGFEAAGSYDDTSA